MDYYILDENGCPRLAEFKEYHIWRRALPEHTALGFQLEADDINGNLVSTVYLGMDHGFGDGPPVLWETMMFNDSGRPGLQERYTSRQEAQAGHERICNDIR